MVTWSFVMRYFSWILMLLLWSPAHLLAQAFPPDLIVRLHDATGAGVPNVMVFVRDQTGAQELWRTTTDTEGRAELGGIEDPLVRVGIQGRIGGVPLFLPGADAQGIALTLHSRPTQLDLRVEADGMVRPDPATMIAPDPSLAHAAVAQAEAQATILTMPQAPTASSLATVRADAPSTAEDFGGSTSRPGMSAEVAATPEGAQGPTLLGWSLVVAFLGLLGLGVLAYQRWGRQ